MEIDISQERFVAHGLMILARNYLDVYPYDRWSDKVINHRCSQVPMGLRGCRKAVVVPLWSHCVAWGMFLGLEAVFC